MEEKGASSKFRAWVLDASTVVVALCAVILAASVLHRQLSSARSGPPSLDVADREVTGWTELLEAGRRLGSPDARITVLEFGDYECPYCRRAERVLSQLREAYPDDLAVVFRHLPLPNHPNALRAAQLSECGARQGRFPQVHSLLMKAIELGGLEATEVARLAGIPDELGFVECARPEGQFPGLEADRELAEQLGIRSVPKFVIEGVMLGRSPDSAGLVEIITHQISGRGRSVASGEAGNLEPER